ncbi:hypothetical protein [Stenotrophomonas phage RAS14]
MKPYTHLQNQIKNEMAEASFNEKDLDTLAMWINKIFSQSSGSRMSDSETLQLMRQAFKQINVCYDTFNELVFTTLDNTDLDAPPPNVKNWHFDFDSGGWANSPHYQFDIKEEMIKVIASEAHMLMTTSFINTINVLTLPENHYIINTTMTDAGVMHTRLHRFMDEMKIKMGVDEKGYDNFVVLTSPMVVTLLQYYNKSSVTPEHYNDFRGPNNIMTAGRLSGAKIVSNISSTDLNSTYIIYNNPNNPVVKYAPKTGIVHDIALDTTNTFNGMNVWGAEVDPNDFIFNDEAAKNAFMHLTINIG